MKQQQQQKNEQRNKQNIRHDSTLEVNNTLFNDKWK